MRHAPVLAALLALNLAHVALAGKPAKPAKPVDDPRAATALRPALVPIPAGSFQMGSPSDAQRLTMENFIGLAPGADVAARSDEMPMHAVTVSAFEMCQTEVTRGQLATLRGVACEADCDHPAVQATWFDAAEALNALTDAENAGATTPRTRCYAGEHGSMLLVPGCTGYRLPTEAEWEYAARAGSPNIWPHGNTSADLKKYAWYDANAKDQTHPVAKLAPNPWGLYDMFGNAGEWVGDWYGPYSSDPATDPVGPEVGEFGILRGGGFTSNSRWARAAARDKWGRSNTSIRTSGYRCARSEG